MIQNRISVEISQPAQETSLKAIETINQTLPFLISLTPKEKKSMTRIGEFSQPFLDKALEVAIKNSDLLPKGFKIEEMSKDVEAIKAIETVRLSLVQLLEKLEDTQSLLRSEAYAAALVVYFLAKSAGKSMGLETVTDELAKRFSRKLKAKQKSSDQPPSK